MNNIKSFIRRNKVRIQSAWTDRNPHMADDGRWQANHYKVRLRHGGAKMDLYYSKGIGLTGEPTAAEVLDCLASDAAGVESASNYHDWCHQYGYDPDEKQAKRTWRAVCRQAGKLKELLGNGLYQQLLYKTERL